MMMMTYLLLAATVQGAGATESSDHGSVLDTQEHREQWEHKYAEVNGVRLHYVERGTGTTVLFLHGFPEFWYEWKEPLLDLGGDHHAVALDMRGYNLSEKPESVDAYRMPNLVADVKGLLDALSPGRKAILVGHDWGGVVAWVFAATNPDYVERLVIVNAPHPALFGRAVSSEPAQRQASSYLPMFASDSAETVLARNDYAWLKQALFEGGTRPDAFSDEDRTAYLRAWSRPGALTGGLNYYRASGLGQAAASPPTSPPSASPSPRTAAAVTNAAERVSPATAPAASGSPGPPPAFPVIHVPTLVPWGEQDRIILASNLDGLEEMVTDLRIRMIPTGSHWVIHEEAALVTGAIREFIDEDARAAELFDTFDPGPEFPFGRMHPDAPAGTEDYAFMVGEWSCREETRTPGQAWTALPSRTRAYWYLNGHGIRNHTYTPTSASSMTYQFDPAQGSWFVMNSTGPAFGSSTWSGSRDGETRAISRRTLGPGGDSITVRLAFEDIRESSFRWVGEAITPAGSFVFRRKTCTRVR